VKLSVKFLQKMKMMFVICINFVERKSEFIYAYIGYQTFLNYLNV